VKEPIFGLGMQQELERHGYRISAGTVYLRSRISGLLAINPEGGKIARAQAVSPYIDRRFLLHVLPRGFVKIRHFGFLANPIRRKGLALCRTLLPAPQSVNATNEAPVGVAETKCPVCKVGTMHIIERISAAMIATFNTS
jgi:hypothetical protein